jgi:hypothetical protein
LQWRRVATDQGFFLDPAEPLDAVFQALRGRPIPCFLFEHQFQRAASTQVLRAAGAAAMFLEAPLDIERNAGIQAAVGAAQYV